MKAFALPLAFEFGRLTMATAEQIKSLIKSHFSDQQEQFYTIALQLAAHEARQGYQSLVIKRASQAVEIECLDIKNGSLADLYDEVTMPPELRKAHQNNDRAVMEAYGFDWRTMTESECVAELFKLYQQLVEAEQAINQTIKPQKSRQKKV